MVSIRPPLSASYSLHTSSARDGDAEDLLHSSLRADATDGEDEEELPCEPAGDGAIATGNVASCKEF